MEICQAGWAIAGLYKVSGLGSLKQRSYIIHVLTSKENSESIMSQNTSRFWVCLISTTLAAVFWISFKRLFALNLPALSGLLFCLGFGLIVWITTSRSFFRRYVGAATPESLGAIRVITCTILLIMVLWLEDLPSSAWLPEEMRHPMGMLNFFYAFPGFESFVRSQTSLQLFEWLTMLLLFLGLIGWQTRVVLPLGAFCYFLQGGILRHYSWFSHSGLIPLYVMAVLSLTPCSDGLSVDRLWKVYQGRAVPAADRASAIYGWSRYACWVVIALPYVAAGLSKLRNGGLLWWEATNMRFQLYQTALAPMQFDFSLAVHLSHAPDILFALLGIAGVYGELAYGLVLFSQKARWILPPLMAMMHLGILFFQDILFLDLILLQLVFFDFTRIRKAIARWIASRQGFIQILYDGFCPFCRRTVRLLNCFDLFERLQLLDFRQLDLTDYNRTHALNLKLSDLEKEMYVIDRGRPYPGFYGYRIIALALPEFWPLVPLLYLPGLSSLGIIVYSSVARHRLKLIKCDSQCELKPSDESKLFAVTSVNDTFRSLPYPLAISGLIIALLLCWYCRIEFYPFTAMQMFSGNQTSGVVTYNKVIAHYDSGVSARAYPEKIIPALYDTRYRRAIRGCFSDNSKKLQICNTLLKNIGSIHNKKVQSGEKIEKIEIQLWDWNFRENPSDPAHGDLVKTYVVQID